jgi:protein-S-isoprenylcysteine O-methyltransferase Ste14
VWQTLSVFVLARALTYATIFVSFLLVFMPSWILTASGVDTPAIGAPQVGGMLIGLAGAVLAASCILTFVFVGEGTPAPFDPPRHLVVRGPYRLVRNPMYIGAALALAGAAIFYQSRPLSAYLVLFVLISHVFVVGYEERALRRSFGKNYDDYTRSVGRWWPRFWSGRR